RVTAQLLARLGCRVRTADCVAAAERALRDTTYDAVVLDYHLPDGDGTALAESLRRREARAGTRGRTRTQNRTRNRARHRTRLVALTASDDAATHARCLAAGMDACVVKPADADTLRAALDDAATPPIVDTARLDTLARLDDEEP